MSSGVPRSLSYAFACGRWWRDFFIFVQRAERSPAFPSWKLVRFSRQIHSVLSAAAEPPHSHLAAGAISGRCIRGERGDAALAPRCPLLCPAGLCPGRFPERTPRGRFFSLLASPLGRSKRIAAGFSAVPNLPQFLWLRRAAPRLAAPAPLVPGIAPCPAPSCSSSPGCKPDELMFCVSPAARRDVSGAEVVLKYWFSSCSGLHQPAGWDEAALPLQFSSHSQVLGTPYPDPAQKGNRGSRSPLDSATIPARSLVIRYVMEFAENKIFGQLLHVEIFI